MNDPPHGATRVPISLIREDRHFATDLRAGYGIDYRSPADAANTGLPSGSIDVVVTTNTLEHIPLDQLRDVLIECNRLMHERSLMTHAIDYSDHYAHSDTGITPYNFLQFTEEEWRNFNPDIHFQNRCRHADYGELFKLHRFEVVSDFTEQPEDAVQLLASLRLADKFCGRQPEVLAPIDGHYVVAKRAEA